MAQGNKPLTAAGNLKKPSIPVVIGWAKTVWECIPKEMVHNSYLKYAISNKMDGTKDSAMYEDFLGEGIAETEDVVDNNSYADYFDDSSAKHEILDYNWAGFFGWQEWFQLWGILIILLDRRFCKNWQASNSEVDLNLYSEHKLEETITGSKIDLDFSAGLTNMRVYTVLHVQFDV